ncbi:PmoA family protein [Glycomyces harbinensis]|uniref:Methane oxygenase PmoA n=1 Tax=Glycomyces harbinensis TaxID=58114 RepID=A0A1G7AWB3_9ACTN|nr:PmoA family protein [Glycomyces harbinensis]SDE18246.1 Methane oxygenase PmoA [Glycomyces harbinensis]
MTLQARHDIGSSLTVLDGETPLLRYVYRPDTPQLESPKPYLSPLHARSGRQVSLFRPWDHVWHKGIAWSLPVVEDENFWGGPTYVHGKHYVQLDNNGTQLHQGIAELEADGDRVAFAHDLEWITQGGERWFTERRAIGASLISPEAWALTFDTAMTNVSGHDIAIGSPTTRGRENAGYGGLFWRGPRSFTDGTLVTADGSGPGSEMRGQHHEWMAFAGRFDEDDANALVLMVDHHENPQHPPQWFARSEEFAALNPAPFFSEEVTVPAGATVRFRYGVGVADADAGAAPDLAKAVRGALNA